MAHDTTGTNDHDTRRARSSPGAAALPQQAADWLPSKKTLVTSRAQQNRFIETHKDDDWFIRLATEMESRDATQAKLLVKFYLFMLEFLPNGFTGEYAHIKGDDVMHHLLCHNEHTASRHKVSRCAEAGFAELEKWKKGSGTWQQAVKSTKPSTRGKKNGWLAAGLHSPAGILAILILAFPDPDGKYRAQIQRLEIDWMTRKREDLVVGSGFWEGITESIIYTVFRHEEIRQAEVPMLADYTQLFAQFTACRGDMKPYLPDWAQHISLARMPDLNGGFVQEGAGDDTDGETNDETGELTNTGMVDGDASGKASDGTRAPDEQTKGTTSTVPPSGPADVTAQEAVYQALYRSHINPNPAIAKDLPALQAWLLPQLRAPGSALSLWCQFWEAQINAATNYQQQMTVRSLFRQSLQRLVVFADAGIDTQPYLVLDAATLWEPDEQSADDALRSLRKGKYARCEEANIELLRRVDSISQESKDTLHALFTQQAYSILYIMRFHACFTEWTKVIELDTYRTRLVIQELAHGAPFWRDKRDSLLVNAQALQLTSWQQRALLCGAADVLTPEQARHFRQNFCPELTAPQDAYRSLSVYDTMPVAPDRLPDPDVHRQFKSLFKLFGSVDPPSFNERPTPTLLEARTLPQPVPPPKRRLPTPTPVATRTPTPPVSPTKRKNVFAGESYFPDQHDSLGRSAKVPKLLSRVDLTEQLTALQTRVESAPGEQLAALQGHLDTRLRVSEASLDACLQASLRATEAKIEASLQEQLAKSTENILQRTKDELVQEVQGQQERLAQRLAAQAPPAVTPQDMQEALAAQQIKASAEIRLLQDQVIQIAAVLPERASANQVTRVAEQLAALQQQLTDQVASQAQYTKVATDVVGLQERFVKVESQLATQSEALGRLEGLMAALGKDLQKKLQYGDDGYLNQACPAPARQDQKYYNSSLLRAGWFYIDCLGGGPDEVLCADERALEMTKEQYSQLPEDHIVETLNHINFQLFRQPLRRRLGSH